MLWVQQVIYKLWVPFNEFCIIFFIKTWSTAHKEKAEVVSQADVDLKGIKLNLAIIPFCSNTLNSLPVFFYTDDSDDNRSFLGAAAFRLSLTGDYIRRQRQFDVVNERMRVMLHRWPVKSDQPRLLVNSADMLARLWQTLSGSGGKLGSGIKLRHVFRFWGFCRTPMRRRVRMTKADKEEERRIKQAICDTGAAEPQVTHRNSFQEGRI